MLISGFKAWLVRKHVVFFQWFNALCLLCDDNIGSVQYFNKSFKRGIGLFPLQFMIEMLQNLNSRNRLGPYGGFPFWPWSISGISNLAPVHFGNFQFGPSPFREFPIWSRPILEIQLRGMKQNDFLEAFSQFYVPLSASRQYLYT